MNPPTPTRTEADSATVHQFLVGQLGERKKELVDAAFRHATLSCLLLGWIISSQQAQRFFAASWQVCLLASGSLACYAVLYSWWVTVHYRNSRLIFQQLKAVEFMDPRHFEFLAIRRGFARAFMVLHGMMCLVMIALIWIIPRFGAELLAKP